MFNNQQNRGRNFNPRNFALGLINQNPNVANNPQAQEYLGVIQSGDAQKGTEIANNICKSYGMTPQEALERAKQFFNLK